MTDVCLVLMPYAAIERPSLALGLLKASLQENGIEPTVLYPNLWFTQDIGIYNYKVISEGLAAQLVGEWTFSGVAFPDFEPNHSDYFSTIPKIKEDTIKELWRVREKAAAFVDRVAQSILELQPRIVSCSSTFHQHCASLALLRRIRELAPEIITIMGGANCEGVMGLATHQAFPWVDFVCSGEGDEILAKLCGKILERGQYLGLKDLPYGVIGSAHQDKEFAAALAPRASVPDLDRIAIPNYDDYFQALQNCPKIAPYITPGMFVETSRGCWWGQKQHCTFCGLNGAGMTYRSKSPERVVREFSWLSQRYGQRKFFVVDNILDLKHIDTVLPMFRALEKPYAIFYETKANLKRQQVQQLAEAGVRWLQPGIESMHDALLALMKKGNTALMNVQLLKWAREFGIQVFWNFLVGLPGECGEWYAEMMTWLPLIAHLQPPSEETRQVRFDRFSPYYERSHEYGLTLVPQGTYSYIYPLDAERLKDLAYSFEEVGEERKIPEHQQLREWVSEWQRMFKSEPPPMLSVVEDKGDRLKLVDTRSCATEPEMSLGGLAYQVYVECDRTLTYRELMNTLDRKYEREVSWDEIQLVVEDLQKRRILLELNGRLLSLAVREPIVPLLDVREQPAGFVDLQRYVSDSRKVFWQL
ncbi:MAG TPA: RiPP maturation radical SAM protein 1 [Cyanobacteria bacterium UBA8803]|nr:RiPP maturation radical SAM protein 1 [Cyanobacteria bacterium UBA9273]HBL61965.1 RiPP maturation radical SAM protein 1 [Cyanobacteria bacterium UBA8803]